MTDFLAVSNDELGFPVEPGERVQCPKCGQPHPLEGGADQHGQPTNLLLFYHCPIAATSMLGAISGHLLPGVELVFDTPPAA